MYAHCWNETKNKSIRHVTRQVFAGRKIASQTSECTLDFDFITIFVFLVLSFKGSCSLIVFCYFFLALICLLQPSKEIQFGVTTIWRTRRINIAITITVTITSRSTSVFSSLLSDDLLFFYFSLLSFYIFLYLFSVCSKALARFLLFSFSYNDLFPSFSV